MTPVEIADYAAVAITRLEAEVLDMLRDSDEFGPVFDKLDGWSCHAKPPSTEWEKLQISWVQVGESSHVMLTAFIGDPTTFDIERGDVAGADDWSPPFTQKDVPGAVSEASRIWGEMNGHHESAGPLWLPPSLRENAISRAREQLIEVSTRADGWHDEGESSAATGNQIDIGRLLIERVDTYGLYPPSVVTLSLEGAVRFEWSRPTCYAVFDIEPDETITVVVTEPHKPSDMRTYGSASALLEDISEIIGWFSHPLKEGINV